MKKLLSLLKAHKDWRKDCINLIASENVMSPLAEKVYLSDLMTRYAEGLPFKRYYQGLKYVDEIENLVINEFKNHFKCNFVDLRPISGTLANLAVFSALILNKNILPWDRLDPKNPSAIRIGVQEMTRFGMKEREMKQIAKFLKEVILDKKNPEKIKKEVIKFRRNFQKIRYCF